MEEEEAGVDDDAAACASVSATSRTSFMPASTLTRPEMASTWEERRVWLRVSAFTASRTSFRRPVWSVEEEGGDAMLNVSVLFGLI